MLDRKIDDADASVELLEDRKKMSKKFFLVFYIMGFAAVYLFGLVSIFSLPVALMIGFVGVALMIIATWFLIMFAQYTSYLFFIKKGLIKAKEEREP